MAQCLSCKGKKTLTGLGFFPTPCKHCDATGKEPTLTVKPEEVNTVGPETFPAGLISTPKRGRPKQTKVKVKPPLKHVTTDKVIEDK